MDNLEAICPLLYKDLERFRILITSLDRYFDPASLRVLIVIVPDDEVDTMQKALDGISKRHRIALLPEGNLNEQTTLKQGWFKQQLIKLSMAPRVETSYFLVLDADVICCKPVSYADLIPDGRALLTKSFKTVQPDWWKWSAKLLRTDPRLWDYGIRIWKPGIRTPRMGMGVTPAILSTSHTRDLIRYLQQLWGLPLSKLLSDHPFTEYTLYHLYI